MAAGCAMRTSQRMTRQSEIPAIDLMKAAGA